MPGIDCEFFENILDSLSSGIVAIDRKGDIVVFNTTASRILGVPKPEALGKKLVTIVPNARLINVLRTGEPEVDFPNLIASRTVMTNRAPIFRNGELAGAVANFYDITEMDRISHELDSTKSLVRTLEELLTGSGEWMVVVNATGVITMISEGYAEFLGVIASEVIGKHITEVIENTRMHIVVKTGVAEMGQRHKIRGREIISNRIPLKEGDRVMGAYGRIIFKDMEQFRELALKLNLLESKVKYYEEELTNLRGARYNFASIIGTGPSIQAAKDEALQASRTDSTVLLQGETGTGKELFAHAIHAAGSRGSAPFIKLNCAAVPAELLESELFGYEEGAFTGAKKGGKPGKFEMAEGGTLFLDEIGDMPLSMQAKLLRVLQEREVDRLGGTSTRQVDIRIIAATGRNIEELVKEGKFRTDLYYRINVIPINIPSLRERCEDIMEIAEHFLDKLSGETGEPKKRLSTEFLEILKSYAWPGNVRELRNILERATAMARGGVLLPEHLPVHLLRWATGIPKVTPSGSLASARAVADRIAITAALKATNGNKAKASKILGIHRVNLYGMMRRYEIPLERSEYITCSNDNT